MNTNQPNTSQSVAWLTLPTRHSWWIMSISIALLVLAAFGGKNLYFRGDYNIFFDGENAQLQAYDEIQTTFAKSDSLADCHCTAKWQCV